MLYFYKYLHLGGRKEVLVKMRSFEPIEVSQGQQSLGGQGDYFLIIIIFTVLFYCRLCHYMICF